jgi:pilus assembly protein CpaF
MKLSDRLQKAGTPAPAQARPAAAATAGTNAGTSALAGFKASVHQSLVSRLGARLYDATISPEQLNAYVAQEISDLMASTGAPLSVSERHSLTAEILDDVMGLGPIEKFLADPTVSEIMVNSLSYIYVERSGVLEQTSSAFSSDEHLRRVIERIVGKVGRRIDESSPMVDARLTDGSRVNAIIPPLSVDGPVLTIRKFSADPLTVDDLVQFGTLTPETAALLRAVVEVGLNIMVSGGTGTGKTTMLNVLSGFIPSNERIVTIEDAVELQLQQDHVVRLESRPANIEGRGEVTTRDLVRNALRMRPDRIIVGEVRGPEALDMLQAMNTGHEGSISTVHCNSPRDALARLETMVLMAGLELPSKAIREQVSSAIDLVVHIQRFPDGARRVTHLTEVGRLEGDIITTSDIYKLTNDQGAVASNGTLRATGIRPMFADKLREAGLVSNAPGRGF